MRPLVRLDDGRLAVLLSVSPGGVALVDVLVYGLMDRPADRLWVVDSGSVMFGLWVGVGLAFGVKVYRDCRPALGLWRCLGAGMAAWPAVAADLAAERLLERQLGLPAFNRWCRWSFVAYVCLFLLAVLP